MQAGVETSEPLCGQECLGRNVTWIRWPRAHKCADITEIITTFLSIWNDTSPRVHSGYFFTHCQSSVQKQTPCTLIPKGVNQKCSHYLTSCYSPNMPHFTSLNTESCFTAHHCNQAVTLHLTSQQGYLIMRPSVPSPQPCPESSVTLQASSSLKSQISRVLLLNKSP